MKKNKKKLTRPKCSPILLELIRKHKLVLQTVEPCTRPRFLRGGSVDRFSHLDLVEDKCLAFGEGMRIVSTKGRGDKKESIPVPLMLTSPSIALFRALFL